MATAKLQPGPLHLAVGNAAWKALVKEVGKERASLLVAEQLKDSQAYVAAKFDFSHILRQKTSHNLECIVEMEDGIYTYSVR